MMKAVFAKHGVIRITVRSETYFTQRARASAAACRKKRGHGLAAVDQHQAARANCGEPRRGIGGGRFAKKLAVGRVAEIEGAMATRSGVIGARYNRLCFEGREWRARGTLRSYSGGDSHLQIHGDDGNQLVVLDLDFQSAAIGARYPAGNAQDELRRPAVAALGAKKESGKCSAAALKFHPPSARPQANFIAVGDDDPATVAFEQENALRSRA